MKQMTKIFPAMNAWLVRVTGGRIGSQLGRQSILLLHTVGRKSGKAYITPVTYFRDGNRYLVVASNWGKPEHPAWYLNLLATPRTIVDMRGKAISVEAENAGDDVYPQLWALVTSQNDQYIKYQKELSRRIPIVILKPT
jgi:deazaflavin-dependent oxidoreductase (nitroreductase family)